MVTKHKIAKRLPLYYESPGFQVYELGNNRLRIGGSCYYILTTKRDIEESAIVFPFVGITTPAIEEPIGIWGSGSKHLRFPVEQPLEIVIEKEIDVDNLVAAINVTEEEVNQWLGLLLEDYDIDPTSENIEATSSLIRLWLEQQASKSGLKLEEDELSKLFRFAVRLAYESLYVGSL